MGFLASIFGGGDDDRPAPAPAPAPAPVAPAPVQEKVLEEPVEDRTDIDPNLDQALSSAKRTRKALAAIHRQQLTQFILMVNVQLESTLQQATTGLHRKLSSLPAVSIHHSC